MFHTTPRREESVAENLCGSKGCMTNQPDAVGVQLCANESSGEADVPNPRHEGPIRRIHKWIGNASPMW